MASRTETQLPADGRAERPPSDPLKKLWLRARISVQLALDSSSVVSGMRSNRSRNHHTSEQKLRSIGFICDSALYHGPVPWSINIHLPGWEWLDSPCASSSHRVMANRGALFQKEIARSITTQYASIIANPGPMSSHQRGCQDQEYKDTIRWLQVRASL